MIRAVVDTNIAVSGLIFGGTPLKVVEAAIARRFVWVTSPFLIEELGCHRRFCAGFFR